MRLEERLKEHNIEIPKLNPPAANYAPVTRTGNVIYVAGQTPKKDGKPVYTGKLGGEVTLEDGYQAARICALNCLGNIQALGGGLEKIARIVKITCFVASTADFYQQAKVADGATDLLVEIFGENGKPARSAVGAAVLPGNVPVEVEMIVEMEND